MIAKASIARPAVTSHRALAQFGSSGAGVWRNPFGHVVLHVRLAAIAHHSERVDHDQSEHSLWVHCGRLQGKVPAPRVPDHKRPTACCYCVENRDEIREMRRYGERTFDRRRSHAALLVAVDRVAIGQLVSEGCGVVGQSRSPVQDHDGWA
jgi:hypothetical protein